MSGKRQTHAGADTIVGMFLMLDTTDHEHYRTGHIVAAVGNCYLIQFDKLEEDHPLPPMELRPPKCLALLAALSSIYSPSCKAWSIPQRGSAVPNNP